MRRRLTGLFLGLTAALAMAGPALADTVPDPGNYRDSGTAQYFYGSASECGMTTCTDTNVYGQIVELRSGDVYAEVCLDKYTYSIRGGGRSSWIGGCAQAAPDFGDNLSSVSFSGTIPVESCNRRTCTATDVELSVSLDAVGATNAYSRTEKYQFENCTDTYRIRGEQVQAEGTFTVDGTTLDAWANIGSESFAFSTRCR